VGSLFQRPFKARHVSTDEEFLHLSRYIHLNPVTAYLMEIDDLCTSHLSSFSAFTMRPLVNFVNTQFTLGLVGGRERYQKFVANQIDYQRKLAKIKHLLME
jgi:putative transposase